MPYRFGAFQAAFGAICAAAFLISNTSAMWGSAKVKRIVGTIQKIDKETLTLAVDSVEPQTILVPETATVFLNSEPIPFASVEEGRKASIRYVKKKGRLYATEVDVFPTHTDIQAA